jgi:hypothetical protein
MTTFAALDLRVEINSVVMSAHIKSVTMPSQFDELDDTAYGDVGRSRITGLEDGSLQITWNEDFDSSAVDATIWAARKTAVPCKVRPTSAAISATNPEYVGSYLVSQVNPFGNAVGDLASRTTQWPLSDPTGIARNTA